MFKKLFVYWLIVSVVFGALFFLVKVLFPEHFLWPFGVAIVYLSILNLLGFWALSKK